MREPEDALKAGLEGSCGIASMGEAKSAALRKELLDNSLCEMLHLRSLSLGQRRKQIGLRSNPQDSGRMRIEIEGDQLRGCVSSLDDRCCLAA